MDPDFWSKAHGSPAAKPPDVNSGLIFAGRLWMLTKDSRTMAAELWAIPDAGFDLRIILNGALYETQLFKDTNGTKATLEALLKRDMLLAKGWTPCA